MIFLKNIKNSVILALYRKVTITKLTFVTFKAQTQNCWSEKMIEGIE